MREVLRQESRKILDAFGHHPSFVFFSSGNEPSGDWYEPLKDWVRETGEYDEAIGYGGRRIYTAQSGWILFIFTVPPMARCPAALSVILPAGRERITVLRWRGVNFLW